MSNYFYTRRQLAFSNFPVLQIIEATARKVARRDENNPDVLLSGTSLQFTVINQSKDISAIDVTLTVSLSGRRKNDWLFNVLHILEKAKFYRYSWNFIDPKQSAKTFEKHFSQEPILEYELQHLFDLILMEPIEGQNKTRKIVKDKRQQLMVLVEIEYKANRYKSKKLKFQEEFILNNYYDREGLPDILLTWFFEK
jgi:hypothetical protein